MGRNRAAKQMHYRTCIVRAWREPDTQSEEAAWRITLEVPASGVRQGFTSFHDLVEVLWDYLSAADDDRAEAAPPQA